MNKKLLEYKEKIKCTKCYCAEIFYGGMRGPIAWCILLDNAIGIFAEEKNAHKDCPMLKAIKKIKRKKKGK